MPRAYLPERKINSALHKPCSRSPATGGARLMAHGLRGVTGKEPRSEARRLTNIAQSEPKQEEFNYLIAARA